ncbi:hypothetical protein R3P38DRAFT_2756354 [Favolaschia claudopus]|uniref:Uncharacterized protein n=1 Tax=Favolaschia claudopus TaxID=2862362 RepID=A0AAW0EH94_9AGAR
MSIERVNSSCRILSQKLYGLREDPDGSKIAAILSEACRLVRTFDTADPVHSEVVERVARVINAGVRYGYLDLEVDYMPSFAHTREFPLLRGPDTLYRFFPLDAFKLVVGCLKIIFTHFGVQNNSIVVFWLWFLKYIFNLQRPSPWQNTPRPHPSSHALSRFTHIPAPSSSPTFRAISEARCEISSDDAYCEPLRIVSNGSCLVLPSMTGERQRTPFLAYYVLADEKDEGFPIAGRHMFVGLSEVAFAATTDEERKLMFLADSHRIKSFEWADPVTGQIYHEARPTHTLASAKEEGPLAVLQLQSGATLLRAGEGYAALWKLDRLPTHGPDGTERIGKLFKNESSWGWDDDDVEYSAGSKCTGKIKFADRKFAPAFWHPHPGHAEMMLCTTDPAKSGDYSFVSLDLEHGGKTAVRYLGNGGGIARISTSEGDNNVFATGATDGHARLYDTRLPLPALSIRAGTGREDCGGIALIHPDGHPALFTGSTKDQVVRLWDLRARKMLYELSTGNNSVNGMTWDDSTNSLYVCTTCDYVGGDRGTYRRARLPQSMLPEPVPGPRGMPNYDDAGSFVKCWPRQAAHEEGYWGEVFDAGQHRIFRYAFKESPDTVSPAYGETEIRDPNPYGW